MLNLIKYEFIKKYKLILIVLIGLGILNLFLFTKGAAGISIFLFLFPMCMSIIYLVDVIKMYSDDLNRKSGYMLFMTPNSGYKIIVSKMITAIIEGFAILLLYFIITIINGTYIIHLSGTEINFAEIIDVINNLMSGNFGFHLGHVFMFLLTALLFLISFLTIAYTSMTIRKSIFSEIKFGGALSFLIFIFLNWLLSYVSTEIFDLLEPFYDSFSIVSHLTATEFAYMLMPFNILSIVQIIILTLCSGYLLEKKINL